MFHKHGHRHPVAVTDEDFPNSNVIIPAKRKEIFPSVSQFEESRGSFFKAYILCVCALMLLMP